MIGGFPLVDPSIPKPVSHTVEANKREGLVALGGWK